MNEMKETIRIFIQEVKEMNMLNSLYKKQTIDFRNYFKYSGKIEEFKTIKKFVRNQSISAILKSSDPVIKFYYKNSNMSLAKIGDKLGLAYGTVKRKLDEHYKQLKIEKNGRKNTQ